MSRTIRWMSLRAVVLVTLLAACTGTGDDENIGPRHAHIGTWLYEFGARTREEMKAKKFRHEQRESQRALGLRVCEEGEWPQRWGEECNVCGCDEGRVRSCTMALCRGKYTKPPYRMKKP